MTETEAETEADTETDTETETDTDNTYRGSSVVERSLERGVSVPQDVEVPFRFDSCPR